MKRLLLFALIAMAAPTWAQLAPEAALGECWYAAGSAWVPMSSSGTAGSLTPSAILLYGLNGTAAAPVNCDANGNVSPGGTAGGDLSGSYPDPAVVGLDGIGFTNTPLPSLGDVVCYDGVQYTPCPPAAAADQILYVTNAASDIGTDSVWATAPTGTQFTVAKSIPATNTKTAIQSFATASGYPNQAVIPAGEWQADSYVQVSAGANTTTLNMDVYDVHSDGSSPVLLFSFAGITISGNGTGIQQTSEEAIEPAFTMAGGITDRLVVTYSMTHNAGSSITGTLYGGGSTNYSHVHTPIGIDAGVFLPLAGGTMAGTIVNHALAGGTVSGLGTPIAVADGGTGSATAGGALTNLGAASSGANSNITSLSGLTTPLSQAQGGFGAAPTMANCLAGTIPPPCVAGIVATQSTSGGTNISATTYFTTTQSAGSYEILMNCLVTSTGTGTFYLSAAFGITTAACATTATNQGSAVAVIDVNSARTVQYSTSGTWTGTVSFSATAIRLQ